MEHNLTAPKSWKELTEKQLIYISWLMTSRQLTMAELQTYAFVRLTGIRVRHQHSGYWLCEHGKRCFTLSPEQILSFSRQFQWLTTGIGEISPLAKLKGWSHVNNRLEDTPLKQYLACENNYQAYIHTKNPVYLRRLAACFYRPPYALDFSDAAAIENSDWFRRVPFHIMHTVFLWYYGLKSVLHQNFPYFLQKVETILEDEKPEAPNMREQINNIIRALSGGDVTKTGAIMDTETWTALAELNAKAREYRELSERYKVKGKG
jgi:hypothetical protein